MGRREDIVKRRTAERRHADVGETGIVPVSPGERRIDLRDPPYPVQCPICFASAFSLCRNGRQKLVVPHGWRMIVWVKRPDLRVTPGR